MGRDMNFCFIMADPDQHVCQQLGTCFRDSKPNSLIIKICLKHRYQGWD
jgi:hypothetical protein